MTGDDLALVACEIDASPSARARRYHEVVRIYLAEFHASWGLGDLAQIDHLYHFTDARNLPLIKELGGILSSKLLREMGIEFQTGGNQWSVDQDRRTGMDAYVHLCWDYGHPTACNIRQRDGSKVVYLKIARRSLSVTV